VPGFATTTDLFSAMGLAMIPVLFAYSGWQTSSFMTGELKNPARSLPLGMLWGVLAVVVLYVLVNLVSVRLLGANGLMHTDAPASEVMRIALGPIGARLIALAVALSTLGFLSNQMLTSPRVYHAMAQDGSFFKQVAWVHPKTRVPVVAIALQGVVALVITLSGRYDQILNYVTSIDYVFFGMAALALFAFRRRDVRAGTDAQVRFRMTGHPWSTALFGVVAWSVVVDTWIKSPRDSLVGLAILLAAVPIFYLWRTKKERAA
ncbi:MAG: amino acid permease, partial [Candidatus Eremiobacteraeota bacterium]|nr:amino acid permease [Candidatus Eremiobacteraeota bacterium]